MADTKWTPAEWDALRRAELFEGLEEGGARRLLEIGRPRTLRKGEYLFLLGDSADRLFVVLSGSIDLCFPLTIGESVRDVCVETKAPGAALGWSALVKPYRFTLSARAADQAELVAFTRKDLDDLFAAEPALGCAFMRRIAELVGHRFLKVQALWARGLQRAVVEGWDLETDEGASHAGD